MLLLWSLYKTEKVVYSFNEKEVIIVFQRFEFRVVMKIGQD